MKKIIIEEQVRMTPFVCFDFEKGILLMRGYSMSSDPILFYELLIQKSKGFMESACKSMIFEMKLVYFNTVSFRKLLDLICSFSEGTVVKWFYNEDDTDLLESGEIMEMISSDLNCNIYFQFIEVKGSS